MKRRTFLQGLMALTVTPSAIVSVQDEGRVSDRRSRGLLVVDCDVQPLGGYARSVPTALGGYMGKGKIPFQSTRITLPDSHLGYELGDGFIPLQDGDVIFWSNETSFNIG